MSAPKKQTDGVTVMYLLRQAWSHAEHANRVLERARMQTWSKDLLEAFLIQADEQIKNSKAAIEEAAKLLR
jgi:hypothetical protein